MTCRMRPSRFGWALTAVVTLVAPVMGVGLAAEASTSRPIVEGPIYGGVRGYPYNVVDYRVQDVGYVQQEFFVSGVAKTYTKPQVIAPYETRILVIRPETAAFNGTVVAEWE